LVSGARNLFAVPFFHPLQKKYDQLRLAIKVRWRIDFMDN
jgi:hypothetical protein